MIQSWRPTNNTLILSNVLFILSNELCCWNKISAVIVLVYIYWWMLLLYGACSAVGYKCYDTPLCHLSCHVMSSRVDLRSNESTRNKFNCDDVNCICWITMSCSIESHRIHQEDPGYGTPTASKCSDKLLLSRHELQSTATIGYTELNSNIILFSVHYTIITVCTNNNNTDYRGLPV